MIRLQQLRTDAGLSPTQLGEAAGVSHATISRIESGKGAHAGTLRKLADALGAQPSDLLRPAVWPDREAAA